MNEKTSPPTGTKTQTAKAPPDSKSSKRKSGGGWGWLFWLFLLVGLYGVFPYKKQVEDWTGWSLPPLSALISSSLKKVGLSSAGSNKQAKKPAATPVASESAANGRINELQTEVRQLSRQLREMREAVKGQTARADIAEQRLGREIAQNSQSTGRNDDGNLVELQLQLINLRLRLNGDSEEAATELRRVAETAPSAMVEDLRHKAARLDKTVKRADLLKMLRDMRVFPAKSKDTAIIRQLKDIFKYRRVNPWNDLLMKLEQLLLLGNYEEYRRLLNNKSLDERWSRAAKADLNKLINLDIPASHLQLP